MAYAKSDLAPGALSPWSAVAIQGLARWYCLESLLGSETLARDHLARQDFVPYLPMYARRVVSGCRRGTSRIIHRPLFPGYLFVLLDLAVDPWRRVCSTRGVRRIFGTTPECPTALPSGAIERMMETASKQSAVPDETLAALAVGTTCRVTEGAIAGHVVTVEWSDTRRVRVLLGLLGQASVTLDRRAVVAV